MTGLEIIALVNASIAAAEGAEKAVKAVMAAFDRMVAKGEITKEQQAEVAANYQRYLETRKFTGPEWLVEKGDNAS